MLTLGLYPYVYLLSRVAFLEVSVCTIEVSRSLGCNPWRSFFTVALPLARPSIVAGLALALMETLNDFGTVQHFGVSTFTTGIYRTWFGLGDRPAASQLAAFLLLFILALILLENWSRRQARYYQRSSSDKTMPKYQLGFVGALLAWIACFLPVALGLLIPVLYLLQMTIQNAEETLDLNFGNLATNSFILAAIGAVIAVAIATILAYGQRLQSNWSMNLAVRTSSMGYAIPGSVIAVGVLIPIGNFDNGFDSWMRSQFGISTGLLLSGTIFTLIFAYIVRFLAVAFGTIESSLNQIAPSLDDASRSLGYTPTLTLWKVHLPLMWRGLLTAGILVFVDVMKELSATIVIRPFNFDTLAIRVYQYASDERLVEASAPALAIIIVGVIPVILLSLRMTK
jgi:iron(III) transport system permease protein